MPPTQAPTDLKASVGADLNKIFLSWNAVGGATGYEVRRGTASEGPWESLDPATSTSFADNVGEQNQGKWYWYRVRACNQAGCGPWSSAVRGYAGRPPKPQGLHASDGQYHDKILVSWDAMPGSAHYQVFRDPGPQPGASGLVFLAEVGSNSYEDRAVRVGRRYRYAVRACNGYGCSELSEVDTGCIEPCPPLFSLDEE